MKRRFIIDLETVPQPLDTLAARMPEFEPPANLKDPEKIQAALVKKRTEWLDKAALSWHTAQVVLVGWGEFGGEIQSQYSDKEHIVVGNALTAIEIALSAGHKVGGHNVKGFDIPMLIRRAWALGINVPPTLVSFGYGRYPRWHDGIFDTLEWLSFGGDIEGNGVEEAAKTLGLPGKLGSGADFPALWLKDREAAIAYNRRDVEIEMALAERLGV